MSPVEAQMASIFPAPGWLRQEIQVAQGRGHAPVLKGGAGVLAVVLEIKGGAHLGLKVGVGRHLGGVAFAQVDDVGEGDHRGDEFVVPENAAQGREIEHPAVIEEPPPEGPGVLGQARGVFILQHEQTPARGAGVEQLGDAEFSAALQAAVNHLPGGGGDEMGTDVVGELFGFQRASALDHRLEACATYRGHRRHSRP